MREALSKNERWNKEYVPVVQPMLQRQDVRFLNPVVDMQPPAPGGVYELRIYRMQPGKAGQWAQAFKAVHAGAAEVLANTSASGPARRRSRTRCCTCGTTRT